MTREKQVSELLMQWEERQKQGNPISPEELCADCPELLPELKEKIEIVKAMNPVLDLTPLPGNSTISFESQSAPSEPKELPSIPGYDVQSELTPGGMGVVYKVANLKVNGRPEALKMIRPEAKPNLHLLQRFQVEIDAIAQFQDPRIVRIYTTGEHNGLPFFTMEFVKGGSLADHLGRFKGNQKAAVQLLAKVARSVHFMHSQEKTIIHRDLKPGNILLKEQDEPVVSDFGLAKFFDQRTEDHGTEETDTDSQLTVAGTVMGTVHYMSPEQAAGKTTELTPATDIWALGVMLYELLTGRRPFLGENADAVRKAIQTDEPKHPRALQPKIDKDLEAICLRCLEKEPRHRFPSALSLADDLGNWQQGKPTQTRPLTMLERLWRKTKKNWRIPVAITLAMCIMWAIWELYVGPTPDPNQWERDVAAKFKDEGKITLIGPKGGPRGFRWIFGEETSKVRAKENDPFWIASGELCLLELMGNVPGEGFQLAAEIKQDTSAHGLCEVGLYCFDTILGNISTKTPKPGRGLMKFTFNEFESHSDGSANKCRLFLQPRNFDRFDGETSNPFGGKWTKFDPIPNKWRKLFVTVTPQTVEGKFDDIVMEKQLWTDLVLPTKNLANPEMEMNRHGGLGIFVRLGSAHYRNVDVSSLPAKQK